MNRRRVRGGHMKRECTLAVLETFLYFEEEAGVASVRLTDEVVRVGEALK